jgi:hypothetical protein
MTYKVTTLFTVKTKLGDLTLNPGQVVILEEVKAKKLIGEGKLIPLPFEAEALNERMAIMGENCEPEQTEPFVTDFGVLVIPFNSDKKYHYWKGGQSVCNTLKELGRCDLIPKYRSIYSDN